MLETLGRKTFETVTVSEQAGETQRRRLKIPIPAGGDRSEKPTLSQVLRELKEKAEQDAKQKQQEQEARRCNYAALFEDAQGKHFLKFEILIWDGEFLKFRSGPFGSVGIALDDLLSTNAQPDGVVDG